MSEREYHNARIRAKYPVMRLVPWEGDKWKAYLRRMLIGDMPAFARIPHGKGQAVEYRALTSEILDAVLKEIGA